MRVLMLLWLSVAAISSHASELPSTAVCPQMEEAGDRLVSGQPGDFYFVDVGSTEFPVPSFFLVTPQFLGGKSAIELSAHPSVATSRSESIRKSVNPCDWSLTARIGPLEGMFELAGGRDAFEKMVEDTYQAGRFKVSLLKAAGLDTRMVVARDDAGYIVFFSDKPERAYWLIRLAVELSSSE